MLPRNPSTTESLKPTELRLKDGSSVNRETVVYMSMFGREITEKRTEENIDALEALLKKCRNPQRIQLGFAPKLLAEVFMKPEDPDGLNADECHVLLSGIVGSKWHRSFTSPVEAPQPLRRKH